MDFVRSSLRWTSAVIVKIIRNSRVNGSLSIGTMNTAQASLMFENVTSEDHHVCVEVTERDARKRIPTEKGESLRLERLAEERKAAGATLRKQITKVSSLLESIKETDARVLEQERDSLDLYRDRMNDAHNNYYKELRDAKELDEAYKWFDLRDREHFQCRIRINEALRRVEK